MKSLQRRLQATVLLVSLAVYSLTAGVFYLLIQHRLRADLVHHLEQQAGLIEGLIEVENGQIEFELSESHGGYYVQPLSGAYYVVSLPGQPRVLSRSFAGRPAPEPAGPGWHESVGPAQEPLLSLQRDIRVEGLPATIWVAATQAPMRQLLWQVALMMLMCLVVAGALLLAGLLPALRWGLKPLTQLRRELDGFDLQQPEWPAGTASEVVEFAALKIAFARLIGRLHQLHETEVQLIQEVSHQLKTPVSVVISTSDVTLQRPRTPEQYAQALARVGEAGRQLRQAINRLISLAHLESRQRGRLRREALDGTALVRRILGHLEPLAQARGIRFELAGPAAAPLRADGGRLAEAVTILLENALAHSPDDGLISLRLDSSAQAFGVEIHNQGPAIDPAEAARLFERFYRGASGAEYPGSGLGLYIAQQIAQQHGGRIEILQPLSGAAFRLWLPAQAGLNSVA